MNRRTLPAVILGLFVLTTLGCTKELKEFSPDPAFRVLMPGTPKEQTQTVMGLTAKMWGTDEKDGAYVVGASDIPGVGTGSAELDQRLTGARDGALRNVNGTLTKEEKITLAGKYPGRHIEADIPSKKGALKARIYMVNGRLYQVLAIGTKDFLASENTDRFLGSLELKGEPAPANPAKEPATKSPATDPATPDGNKKS